MDTPTLDRASASPIGLHVKAYMMTVGIGEIRADPVRFIVEGEFYLKHGHAHSHSSPYIIN